MQIKPIKTDNDYRVALKEIEGLFNALPDTPEGDSLDVLVTLVSAYEATNYPNELPNPIEAIQYHMERLGLSRKDLEKFIGSPSHVSEILNRKRPLTLQMIRNLNKELGISLEILTQEYETFGKEQAFDGDTRTFSSGVLNFFVIDMSNENEALTKNYVRNRMPDIVTKEWLPKENPLNSGTISKKTGTLPFVSSINSGGAIQ